MHLRTHTKDNALRCSLGRTDGLRRASVTNLGVRSLCACPLLLVCDKAIHDRATHATTVEGGCVQLLHGCTHCFHADCVSQWRKSQLLDQQCCPECRSKPCLEPINLNADNSRDTKGSDDWSEWWGNSSSHSR